MNNEQSPLSGDNEEVIDLRTPKVNITGEELAAAASLVDIPPVDVEDLPRTSLHIKRAFEEAGAVPAGDTQEERIEEYKKIAEGIDFNKDSD